MEMKLALSPYEVREAFDECYIKHVYNDPHQEFATALKKRGDSVTRQQAKVLAMRILWNGCLHAYSQNPEDNYLDRLEDKAALAAMQGDWAREGFTNGVREETLKNRMILYRRAAKLFIEAKLNG